MVDTLTLTLLSDTNFGRGDGVAGLVDAEVEHETETGLPFLGGRALKGLLVEECSNLLFAIEFARGTPDVQLRRAASFLFGEAGNLADAVLHVGPAILPRSLRAAIVEQTTHSDRRLTATDVLEALTTIRRQTAVETETGAPADGSLRAIRVILRDLTFTADLHFREPPDDLALALLAGCTLAVRRVGTGRNRGLGRVRCRLAEAGRDVTWSLAQPLWVLCGEKAP